MRYKLSFNRPVMMLSVEDSFTLLDFMALLACLLLGVFFMVFLWIFAFALLVRLFTRHEYSFNSDSYELTMYVRILGYLRIRRRVIPFDDVDHFLFSNFDSGNALAGRGFVYKEWFTLDIVLKDKHRIQLVKLPPDDVEQLNELYLELKTLMSDWFRFEVEYEELKHL